VFQQASDKTKRNITTLQIWLHFCKHGGLLHFFGGRQSSAISL